MIFLTKSSNIGDGPDPNTDVLRKSISGQWIGLVQAKLSAELNRPSLTLRFEPSTKRQLVTPCIDLIGELL